MNEFSDPPAHLVGETSEPPGVRRLLPQLDETPPPRREAGWYRDPARARRHRYWTGERWFTQDEVFPELDDGPAPD